MSRLLSGEEPKGVDDDLPDAYLFNIEMVPRWSETTVSLMTIGQLDIPLPYVKRSFDSKHIFFQDVGRKDVPLGIGWHIEIMY